MDKCLSFIPVFGVNCIIKEQLYDVLCQGSYSEKLQLAQCYTPLEAPKSEQSKTAD